MAGADVTLETTDGPMRAYVARPAEPRGAVIVVQEAFGVNGHIEDVTRRLADAGYYAIAPDLFHRSGTGCVVEYGDFTKVMELFKDVSGDESILTDIEGALGHLHDAGFSDRSIGIVGFCFGGRVSFLVALRYALGAAVGFYGGGIVTGRFAQFPPLAADAAGLETRGSACSVTRTRRSRSTTSSSCEPRWRRRPSRPTSCAMPTRGMDFIATSGRTIDPTTPGMHGRGRCPGSPRICAHRASESLVASPAAVLLVTAAFRLVLAVR
jgi:dienelactone hydrolase